jgi:hypothetical protein
MDAIFGAMMGLKETWYMLQESLIIRWIVDN